MESEKKFVTHNGVCMIKGWPEQIQRSQARTLLMIGSSVYNRIRYGDEEEDWGADMGPCHDCCVIKGQIHVWSCTVERCPACGGQLMSCDCDPGLLSASLCASKVESYKDRKVNRVK